MHSTIWLLAFILHTFARDIGALCKGTTIIAPHMRKNIMKNIEPKRMKLIKEPRSTTIIGHSNANEATPAGVTLRWHILMASSYSGIFSLSGWILSRFSLKLHAFSYHVMCV